MEAPHHVVALPEAPRFFLLAWFDAFARRCPFAALIGVLLVSNVAGSFFNFFYNTQLIVSPILNVEQQDAFWNQAAPLYNVVAYPACFAAVFYVIWPLMRCLRQLRRGETVDPAFLQFCRRRLINFPIVQLIINPIGILPGAVIFPWIITLRDPYGAGDIWTQFAVSFLISTVFTTVQTFFMLQSYLTGYLYPMFFSDTRPAAIPGARVIPFGIRLVMLWGAIALMPLAALLAVTLNIESNQENQEELYRFAAGLFVVGSLSGGAIFWLVGRDIWRWIQLQRLATGQIAEGNFDIRIDHPRPDELGRLTNRFNDMASALHQAWESHVTLGQFVSPDVRDHILRQTRGFEVHLQVITVLFVDIRGFTPRCASESPERIGALLNQFLTLTVGAIEEKGGYVNKFLGDGVMALFGATNRQDDHADRAFASAQELLVRLRGLNDDLTRQGQAPLVLGIGIHSGPALVGCFGAEMKGDQGQPVMRREFTAIGETVNMCQRIEQLTKKCGGPILVSDDTRQRLNGTWLLQCVGAQEIPGAPAPTIVHRVQE